MARPGGSARLRVIGLCLVLTAADAFVEHLPTFARLWRHSGRHSLGGRVDNDKSRITSMRSADVNVATILLVRHGQTEWNVQGRYQGQMDSPLTELGRQEARALGERLRKSGDRIDSIWSSDLPRARNTAQEVAVALRKAHGGQPGLAYTVNEDARLRERSFGILEGLTREECRKKHPNEMRKFSSDGNYAISGGGESRATLVARTEAALIHIAEQNRGKTCVVVTHGAVVSTFLRFLLGIPFDVSPKNAPKGDLQIRNTCICELKYLATEGRWLVLSLGDVAHTQVCSRACACARACWWHTFSPFPCLFSPIFVHELRRVVTFERLTYACTYWTLSASCIHVYTSDSWVGYHAGPAQRSRGDICCHPFNSSNRASVI